MDKPISRFWEKLKEDGFVIFLTVLLAFYFGYLSYITSPVPNTTYVNESGILTTQIRYTADSMVPKSHITGTQAAIGALGVVLLVWYIYMKHLSRSDIISELEAWNIVKKELEYKRDILKLHQLQGRIECGPNVLLRTRLIGQDSRPWKYVCGVKVTEKDGLETYYFIGVDPYTGYIKDILPSEVELSHFHTCANCGKYSDLKYVDPTDYYRLIHMAKAGSPKQPNM